MSGVTTMAANVVMGLDHGRPERAGWTALIAASFAVCGVSDAVDGRTRRRSYPDETWIDPVMNGWTLQ